MPVMNTRSVILTTATATPLVGLQYEFLPFNAQVEIAVVANVNLVLATVYAGSDLLVQEGPVQLSTVDFMPVYPDHFYLRDVAAQSDRLSILLRNTNAASATVLCSVMITPI